MVVRDIIKAYLKDKIDSREIRWKKPQKKKEEVKGA